MTATEPSGHEYAPGVRGKYVFRVRERYVADVVAPLVGQKRAAAAKLDLALRGLALLPEHAGERSAGWVIHSRGQLSYEALHDLVRSPRRFSVDAPEDEVEDSAERQQKREWVRRQLQILEDSGLLRRDNKGSGRRPELVVLSDLGDGSDFDDPDGSAGNSYLTVPGALIGTATFREWGGPELAAFYCALQADRYAAHAAAKRGKNVSPGRATWYRQADWFNGENPHVRRPDGHVLFPFSTATIERGLKALRSQGLIEGNRQVRSPEGKRFMHPRMVYENRFTDDPSSNVIDLSALLDRSTG